MLPIICYINFFNTRVVVLTQESTCGAQIYQNNFTGVALQVKNFQVCVCGNLNLEFSNFKYIIYQS